MRTLSTTVISFVLSAGAFGCGEEEGPGRAEIAVRFAAHADGRPLPGVELLADSRPIGTTDAQGVLAYMLSGRAGDTVGLRARCPEGYRHPDDLPELLLRPISDLEGQTTRALEIDVPCRPAVRDGVVVVRADGYAGLPVLLDGREVARTDEGGVAHVAVRMAPHASFRVQLATAHMPTLRPQEPSRTFTVPDANEIFVFDQELEREEAPQVRRRRRRPPRRNPTPMRIPVRLGGQR